MSKLPTFQSCVSAIEEMNEHYPRSGFSLELGECFDLIKNYNNLNQCFSGKIGVYILFNERNDVIRIGSSTNSLFSRLNTYFDYRDDKTGAGVGWWKEGVGTRYIRVIIVPPEYSFETLAIERFLLEKLTPPLNKEGRIKYLDYRKQVLPELNLLAALYGWNKINNNWWSRGESE